VITISTYWCDANTSRTDTQLSRIEDVLPGETLWVFQSPQSLEHLCRCAGFALISSREIEAYGCKTMRTFHFRRKLGVEIDSTLLDASREHMQHKLEQLFGDFERQSLVTLSAHNGPNVFFIGTLGMLHDLARIAPLDGIAGYLVRDLPVAGLEIDGVRCIDWSTLVRAVQKRPKEISVVVASYRFQDEINAELAPLRGALDAIYIPNRKSGMETLFLEFGGQERLCKGFTVDLSS